MSARRNLQPLQFNSLSYEKDEAGGMGSIQASHPEHGVIGHVYWNTDPKYKKIPVGGITSVAVHEDFRKRGLATHLFRMAQEMDSRVQHGPVSAQTSMGKKWAKKVPNERPEING